MDASDLLGWLAVGFILWVAIAGGIYVGANLALRDAGAFVEESITAFRLTAFELLANKTLQDAIRAADKIPNLNQRGGILEKGAKFVGKLLAMN